jgi:hypothetical protein
MLLLAKFRHGLGDEQEGIVVGVDFINRGLRSFIIRSTIGKIEFVPDCEVIATRVNGVDENYLPNPDYLDPEIRANRIKQKHEALDMGQDLEEEELHRNYERESITETFSRFDNPESSIVEIIPPEEVIVQPVLDPAKEKIKADLERIRLIQENASRLLEKYAEPSSSSS